MASLPNQQLTPHERENAELREALTALTQRATNNEQTLTRLRNHELALLSATTLSDVIDLLTRGLGTSFGLENVTVALADPQQRWQRLLSSSETSGSSPPPTRWMSSVRLSELSPLFKSIRRPNLGMFNPALHGRLFPQDPKPRSVALLPLRRHENLLGVVNAGSTDPNRFNKQLSSDFLAHFAAISAVFLENVQAREELRQTSYSDPLTGCYNRRFLQERVMQEIGASLRYRRPLCFLLLDLDYFKTVNDTYGHSMGDQVLVEFSQRLRRQLRINDIVARYGGEEFAALLPQTSIADALRLAERIRQKVHEPMLLESGAVSVTVSIGVAELIPRSPDGDLEQLTKDLINAADTALYQAKAAGRNRVERANSLTTGLD